MMEFHEASKVPRFCRFNAPSQGLAITMQVRRMTRVGGGPAARSRCVEAMRIDQRLQLADRRKKENA
jgi:hypothetical protein